MSGDQSQEEALNLDEHNSSIQPDPSDTRSENSSPTRTLRRQSRRPPFDQLLSTEERERGATETSQQPLNQLGAAASSSLTDHGQHLLQLLNPGSGITPFPHTQEVLFDQERPETLDQFIPQRIEDFHSDVPSDNISNPSTTSSLVEPNIRAQLQAEGIFPNMAQGNDGLNDQRMITLLENVRTNKMSVNQKFKLFNGKNISAFLNRYNLKAKEAQATEQDKINYLQSHVEDEIWPKVKNFVQGTDWKEIQQELKDYFKSQDSDENASPWERLHKLNQQLPIRDKDVWDWLLEHKTACQEIDPQGWATSAMYTWTLIGRLPRDLIAYVMDQNRIRTTDQLALKPYREIWEHCRDKITASIDLDESRQTMQNTEFEALIKRSHYADKDYSSDKAQYEIKPGKKTHNPQQNLDPRMETLVDSLQQLSITVSKMAEQMNLKGTKRFEEKDRNTRQRKTHFSSNSLAYPQSYEEELFDQDLSNFEDDSMAVNTIRNRNFEKTKKIGCWYCSATDHFLNDCRYKRHDEESKFLKYDDKGFIGFIGPRQTIAPTRLLMHKTESCMRKMAMLWAESFNAEDNLAASMKKAKRSAPEGFSWEPNQMELELVQLLRRTMDMSIFGLPEKTQLPEIMKRPKPDSPSTMLLHFGEDQLVSQCNRVNAADDNQCLECVDNILKANTNSAMGPFEDTETLSDLDQMVSIAASEFNERKRQRTEEVVEIKENEAAVPRAQPLSSQENNAEKIKNKPIKNTEKTSMSQHTELTVAQSKSVLVNAMMDTIVRVKVSTLLNAMPDMAGEVGNQLIAASQGITKTQFVGKVPLQKNSSMLSEKTLEETAVNAATIKRAYPTKQELLDQLDKAGKRAINTQNIRIPENSDMGEEMLPCLDKKSGPKELWEPIDQEIPHMLRNREPVKINIVKADRIIKQVQELPMMQLRLEKPDGNLVEALLDSGSQGNIMSLSLARDLGLKMTKCNIVTRAYNKEQVQIIGETTTAAYIGNAWIPVRIYIAESDVLEEFILGMPFFRSAQVSFDHTIDSGNLRNSMGAQYTKPCLPAFKINVNLISEPEVDGDKSSDTPMLEDGDTLVMEIPEQLGEEVVVQVALKIIKDQITEYKDEEGKRKYHERRAIKTVKESVKESVKEPVKETVLSSFEVNAMYKRKGLKMNPVDNAPPDGSTPAGNLNWKRKKWEEIQAKLDPDAPFAEYITPKFGSIDQS
ncbi:hypothetical protein GGI43DRAFT_430341 [Trichoderma evansii]